MLLIFQVISLILLVIVFLFLVKKLARTAVRLYVNLNGPFFAPTSDERIKQIIKMAQLKPGMKVADLGSGDGRILIELVKAEPKIKAVGYELDPKYVKISREKIKAAGLEKQIKIKQASFWEADFSEFDIITIYCVQRFMGKLETKLKKEIKKSCKVLSVYFHFPHWPSKKVEKEIRLYQL